MNLELKRSQEKIMKKTSDKKKWKSYERLYAKKKFCQVSDKLQTCSKKRLNLRDVFFLMKLF